MPDTLSDDVKQPILLDQPATTSLISSRHDVQLCTDRLVTPSLKNKILLDILLSRYLFLSASASATAKHSDGVFGCVVLNNPLCSRWLHLESVIISSDKRTPLTIDRNVSTLLFLLLFYLYLGCFYFFFSYGVLCFYLVSIHFIVMSVSVSLFFS